jgi:hypothetical protein
MTSKINLLDLFGQFAWFTMWCMPLLMAILFWRLMGRNKVLGVVLGILIGSFFSMILYAISMNIVFRDFKF